MIKLTRSDDVVDNQHLLPALDGVGLHLEEIAAILLLVLGRLTRAGQLALLAHRDEAGAQTQRQAGAEEEPAGVEPNHDVWLGRVTKLLLDGELQGAQQALVQLRVGEDGQDVFEEDAGLGEVLELAQRLLEL